MDDYNIVSLQESNNEWVSRLINMLSPCVIQGIRDMFTESFQLCVENDEQEKYLMTFQNVLSRVPKWNAETLSKEVERIKDMSKCEYLEDLISCVHIVQLKALTCIRVGQKQKTIDLDIPNFDAFVHKVYIHLARKLFSNVYLFESSVTPLTIQKNNREIELITKDCILEAVRESIPVEAILRAYLDKTVEDNVEQEIVHENVEIEEPQKEVVAANVADETEKPTQTPLLNNEETVSSTTSVLSEPVITKTELPVMKEVVSIPTNNTLPPPPLNTVPLPEIKAVIPDNMNTVTATTSFSEPKQTIKFSNIDEVQSAETRVVSTEEAPKDVVSLERRAEENYQKQLAMEEEDDDDDDDDDRIKIYGGENIILDVETL